MDVLGPLLLGEQHSRVGGDPQLCCQEGLGREASGARHLKLPTTTHEWIMKSTSWFATSISLIMK